MGGHPLLARWTDQFDCGYETNWWYVIKEKPYDPETLSSGARKHIRQALKKCCVRQIDPEAYVEQMYACYTTAHQRYKNGSAAESYEQFRKSCLQRRNGRIFWAGFTADTEQLIGYMIVYEKDIYVEIAAAKFHAEYLRYCVSDAIYAMILQYYLNERGYRYVSSGERNINHQTNTQEYKIRRFGYRKAYCKLNIAYAPKVRWLIGLLYPFRKLLRVFDRIGMVHMLNAVLKMEEIRRKQV